MPKPITSRTLGPLHYEDLEPHRFEDLVRSLLYDFRHWRQIEATGRAGADEGFDARAWEIVSDGEEIATNDDDETIESVSTDRLWLVQCKREQAIGPKKILQYLDNITADKAVQVHGLVLAAACDFSLKARDAFRAKVREIGVAEAYLWGNEVDDMLFQPKNDHLLFAFFGFSLKARRQTLNTSIRSRLAAKRKVLRSIETTGTDVLIRDASDDRYPYLDNIEDRFEAGRWLVRRYEGCFADGVRILLRRCCAYLDDDGEAWDFAEKMNDATPHDDPWRTEKETEIDEYRRSARMEAMEIWDALPTHNRAWYDLFGVIPYDNIIDVDDKADEHFEGPHIYTIPFVRKNGPFRSRYPVKLETPGLYGLRWGVADGAKRVLKFPRETKPNVRK
jgi:hypothetical protein